MLSIGAASQPRTPAEATSKRSWVEPGAEQDLHHRRAADVRRADRQDREALHDVPPSTGRTCRPASGSTTSSWAAATPSASSVAAGSVLRLTIARATGPSSWWRADEPTKPTRAPSRVSVGAVGRQVVDRAVEMQQHEPPRRTSEGVHPGHRLLAAVAALLEVDGSPEQAGLVRDGALVGVDADPADAGRDAQRLPGPDARPARRARRAGPRATSAGRSSRSRSAQADDRELGRRRPTSTRVMKRMLSRNSTSAGPAPGSVWARNVSPSSTPENAVLDAALRRQQEQRRWARPAAGARRAGS